MPSASSILFPPMKLARIGFVSDNAPLVTWRYLLERSSLGCHDRKQSICIWIRLGPSNRIEVRLRRRIAEHVYRVRMAPMRW